QTSLRRGKRPRNISGGSGSEINRSVMSELGLMIPNDDYHKDTSRISKSGLDLINRSPAHYWERYLNPNPAPRPEKEWQRTGGALGCAVLEPDEFPLRYAILDDVEKCKEIGGAKPRS